MIYHPKLYGSANKHYQKRHNLDADPAPYGQSTMRRYLQQSTNARLQSVICESGFSAEYSRMLYFEGSDNQSLSKAIGQPVCIFIIYIHTGNIRILVLGSPYIQHVFMQSTTCSSRAHHFLICVV